MKNLIALISISLFLSGGLYSLEAQEIPLTSDNYNHYDPQWSPDGTEFVYMKYDPINNQIFKISLAGGTEIPLTSDSYHHKSPQWSPDGNWIVYEKRDATRYYQIYRISSTEVFETSNATPTTSILAIFPNPAKTFFEIRSQEPVKSMQIYDVSGRLVKEETSVECKPTQKILLEGVSSGVYFVKLKCKDFTSTKKLLLLK